MRSKLNESTVQASLVKTFRSMFPKYAFCFFAIENQRKTSSPQMGARYKQQGVLAGVADLCLALPTETSGALYIEMKFGKNKQTTLQKEWQKEIIKNGNSYYVCYTIAEAFDIILPYIKQHEQWKSKQLKSAP